MKTLMPALALSLVVGMSPVYANELLVGTVPTTGTPTGTLVVDETTPVVPTTPVEKTTPTVSGPPTDVDESIQRLAELLKQAVDVYGRELPYVMEQLNNRFEDALREVEKVQKTRTLSRVYNLGPGTESLDNN
jgi:hypothetical protein|tara:strand:+ start:198 stop:596 length:399 start_codon:yes stop_codon:yes gene_type:complete